MKSVKKPKSLLKTRTVAALLAIATLLIQSQAKAEEDPNKDWVLKVQTEALKQQFDYKESKLKDVSKVTVEYFHENEPNDIKPYERVYYNHGKPIGMQRTGKFGISPAEIVAIRLTHKANGSNEEDKAAANIIWRLALNTTNNRSQLISTFLPDSSFDGIVKELEALGFGPARFAQEQANNAKCILALESESSSQVKKLFYY